MSSPLDGRIRALAREEAAQAVWETSTPAVAGLDVQGLQQQITDLHEHIHHLATTIRRLEERVDAQEKDIPRPAAAESPAEQAPTQRRSRRKTTGE